ncbi:MAG: hypothetical protein CUN55_03130 [Phototrophicales bacterium]|nr:MAG: hypothetical protein CUN55_03130 [Phototrophicales bacterium]
MKIYRIIAVVFFLNVFWVGYSALAQGGPSDETLERVQAFFSTQYGRDYVLQRYNWNLQTWSDTSLGCPKLGVNYEPKEVRGYEWTFTLADNNTYILHSDLDASLIVLCSDVDRSATMRFSEFRATDFVIEYPSTWQVVANAEETEVIISPAGTEDCAGVGTKIIFRPVVGNANTMLDEAIQQAGFVQNIGVPVPIGERIDALALGYQAACGTNLLQYRIGAFPDAFTSTGYLVIQWTPLEDYSSWSAVYDRMLNSFRLTDTVESLGTDVPGTPPEQALADYPLGHVFVNDVFIGTFPTLPGTNFTIDGDASQKRRLLRFSADGTYLAFVMRDPFDDTQRLEFFSPNTRRRRVGDIVSAEFPPAWAPTGTQLAFVEPIDGGLSLKVVDVTDPNLTAQILGTLPFADGCPASDEDYLPEQLYHYETGPNGNAFTLIWLLDGRYLYTTSCDGIGLAIWNPMDNTIQDLGADLRRGAMNPDRTHFAAMDGDGVVYTVDLATGNRTLVPFEEPAEQLGWGLDGRLLYASTQRAADDGLMIDSPDLEERALSLLGTFPYRSVLNTISIIEFDLNRGTTRTVWQGQGYAIGRIVTAPNNGGLIFSLIPSDRDYVVAFMGNADYLTLRFARPETRLYWVSPLTEASREIAVSAYPVYAYNIPPQ